MDGTDDSVAPQRVVDDCVPPPALVTEELQQRDQLEPKPDVNGNASNLVDKSHRVSTLGKLVHMIGEDEDHSGVVQIPC